MTVTACIVVTCRGGRGLIVADEVFTRKTIKIKPWKIKHVLEELRVSAPRGKR